MSPGFEQLRPSIEGADRRIDASQMNVNLAKVEAEFKKVEAHARMQKNPKLREQYEKMLAEQRAKFDGLKDGNDQNHLDALRNTVHGTLVALDDFVYENGDFLTMNFSRQYAETTGVATVYAAWRKEKHVAFSTLADIIRAYLPGVGPYGGENYRRAVFLFLNQRLAGAQGHSAPYDVSRIHDAAEWTRAEAELRKIKVGEEFDFWRVRVALNQPISRPPAQPPVSAAGPLPDLVPLVPPGQRRARAPGAAPTARPAPARAPAGAPTAGPPPAPVEAAALTQHEQMAINSFAKGIENAFGALQRGNNEASIKAALTAIKAQADGVALYEKKNPSSNALPQLRAMRMQCEAFLTQATLAMRAAQGEQTAKDAREDTRGFWSGLRVLNAIPKAYRSISGDQDTLTYSEARSQVMDMRARELSRPAKGAEVVFAALSKLPPISLQQLRGMGPKRLLAAGLAKAGKENDLHSAVQDFFMSPEGRRLIAIEEGRLTAQLDKALAQQALRVEEGAGWEKAGNITSSLASIDQIALTLATGGGVLVGRLAAQSVLAVRAAAATARALEAAKAIKGLGVAVRAGEAIVTWSPAEMKVLKAAEAAGNTVKVAKALARGTLTIGTSLGKFVAAAGVAETLVPGSGHFVMAACFVVPGAMKGFSEAVGRNVSEAFARAGGNMAAGEMPEMTRAYLLYLRSTRTQAELAGHLRSSLQANGVVAGDAEKAANAFARDLFEGQTGRELEALAAQKKPGVIASVREYLGARRAAKAAGERVGGIPRYGERYRAGAQREAQEAGARLREALGPIGKIDKVPGRILEGLRADLRKTVEDFVGAYNRVAEILKGGLNISREKVGEFITARRGELVALWLSINALPGVARGWAQKQWAKLSNGLEALADSWKAKGVRTADATEEYLAARRLLRQAKEGGGTVGVARQMPGVEAAGRELQEALGVHRIVALPGAVRQKLSADLRQTVADFSGGYKRVMEIVGSGRQFVAEKGAAFLEGAANMVRSLNALARKGGAHARALWESGMKEFRSVVDAVKNDRGAQSLLRQAQQRDGGLLKWGEVGLRKAEVGAVEARGVLVEKLGLQRIVKIPDAIRSGLSADLRRTVEDFVGAYNRVTGVIKGGLNISREKVGEFVTARRGELMQLWQRMSALPAVAREWAQRQWAKLSNGLEALADSWRAKGAKILKAPREYVAARRELKAAESYERPIREMNLEDRLGISGLERRAQDRLAVARVKLGEARARLWKASGIDTVIMLPERLRTNAGEAGVAVLQRLNAMRESIGRGLSVPLKDASNFLSARRGELMQLWQQISRLPEVARGWAQKQWAKLSNGLEALADSWKAKGARTADATEEYLAARRLLRQAREGGGTVGVARQMPGVETAGRELQEALGVHRIVALPGKIRAALSVDLRRTVDDFVSAYNRAGEVLRGGLNVSREKVGEWIAARRGELVALWQQISRLPEVAKGWAQRQWAKLSNGLESFAKSWQAKGVRIADATGEYVSVRKAVRAAGKMEGGVLPGGSIRLEAERRALERARVEFANAIGLTKLQALKGSALLGLKEGAQKAARALIADANAFVEKYAGLAKAARAKTAPFVTEAKALQAQISALIDKLPDTSPLRPLLASTGERLGEMAK